MNRNQQFKHKTEEGNCSCRDHAPTNDSHDNSCGIPTRTVGMQGATDQNRCNDPCGHHDHCEHFEESRERCSTSKIGIGEPIGMPATVGPLFPSWPRY